MLKGLRADAIEPIEKEIDGLKARADAAKKVAALERLVVDLEQSIPQVFRAYTRVNVQSKLLEAVEHYERQQELVKELKEKPGSTSLQERLAKENKKLNTYQNLGPETVAAIKALQETTADFLERIWSMAKVVLNGKEYGELQKKLSRDIKAQVAAKKEACDLVDKASIGSDASDASDAPRGGAGGGDAYATSKTLHGILSGLDSRRPGESSGPGRR